jgi:hypothetical protein
MSTANVRAFLCLPMVAFLACATAGAQETPFEIGLRFFDIQRGFLDAPLPMDYGDGFLIVDCSWPSAYTDKDDVRYEAWIRGDEGDWASANAPAAEGKGWCQHAILPRLGMGGLKGVRMRMDSGYRPPGGLQMELVCFDAKGKPQSAALPEALSLMPGTPGLGMGGRKGVRMSTDSGYRPGKGRSEGLVRFDTQGKRQSAVLPEALPLMPGTHRFTFCVQRTRPGAEPELATKEFQVEVRGNPSLPVLSGLVNDQVFQRKAKGKGDLAFFLVAPSSTKVKVTVAAGDRQVATTSANVSEKNRRVVVKDIPVGGPYAVEVEALGETLQAANVYVGDLWIIGGQSNAVGVGTDLALGRKPMAGVHGLSPKYSLLRWGPAQDGFFEQTVGAWVTAAQDFYEKTKVPVGLMGHAVGGKGMDYFLDPETQEMVFLKPLVEGHGAGAAAFFWYQGESDAFLPETQAAYGKKLAAMAECMRRYSGNQNMMIGIVQLARYLWFKDDHFAAIRETQRQFVLRDGKSVLFSTLPYEINDKDKIHLMTSGYVALGKQVAAQMIHRETTGTLRSPGPILVDAKFDAGKERKRIVVRFDNAKGLSGGEGLDQWFVTDEKCGGFGAAGGFVELDKVSVDPAKGQVVLELKRPPDGQAEVSYGYRCDVGGTLQNEAGFPAAAFVKVKIGK